MRKAITLAAACALVAGMAGAQMKPKPAAPAAPLAIGGAQPQQPINLDSVRRISTAEAFKLANRGEAVIVDVRSSESFKAGHIKGAYSIPGSQLISRLKELPPGKMIITYCACSAEQSSGRAVLELNNHGIKHTAAMKGGWDVWKSEGRPTASGAK